MDRRTFIGRVAGGVLTVPFAARAQQPVMPVIGFLSLASPYKTGVVNAAFHRGLNEMGFVEGRNVTIEYRWAAGHNDRFPSLAADLVRHHVAIIVAAGGNPSAVAAMAATSEIPIVFQVGADPVALGFVANLDRPGRNLTGVTSLNVELGPKRLQLLHEVVPTATIMGLLVNPTNAASDTLSKDAQAAAQTLGLQLHVMHASAEGEFGTVFESLVQLRVAGVVIGNDPFFSTQSALLAALSVRHALPSIATRREFPEAGGLMSYGGSLAEVFRLVGIYTGRILKGETPAEMPVHKSTKLELVINLKTAKALGLIIPRTLLQRADEVIE